MIGVSRRILDSMLLDTKDLTHEVLSTLMAEVCAIINGRPIVPVSTDVEDPQILTPSVLLTQKTGAEVGPFQHLDVRDLYRAQWKHVQVLAQTFWNRWRREYLPLLQSRSKWHMETPNVSVGDVVLLKEKEAPRNEWPVGIITRTFPSDDSLVRKVEVRMMRDNQPVEYTRPITEIVNLVLD
jgi:hypothetical protein